MWQFDTGWQVRVSAGGADRRIHHALAHKQAFGRRRRASVTWLDGEPVAEGTGVVDYPVTRSLCSVVKTADGHFVKPGEPSGIDEDGTARLIDLDGVSIGQREWDLILTRPTTSDTAGILATNTKPSAIVTVSTSCSGPAIRFWQTYGN